MSLLVESPTELTTAATDAVLAGLAIAVTLSLPRGAGLWRWLFLSLAAGSSLAAIAHAVRMPSVLNDLLWHPIYFLLGLTVILLATISVTEVYGESSARRLLPWLLPLPLFAVVAAAAGGGAFIYFILFEAVIMLVVLALTIRMCRQKRPGSLLFLAGLVFSIAAAILQASGPFNVRLIWSFDHNGLFHLVQMPGLACFFLAARKILSE